MQNSPSNSDREDREARTASCNACNKVSALLAAMPYTADKREDVPVQFLSLSSSKIDSLLGCSLHKTNLGDQGSFV